MKVNVPILSWFFGFFLRKRKAESIEFEIGLHVPGGYPGAYLTQEASSPLSKLLPLYVRYS